MKKNLDFHFALLPKEELAAFEDFINSPYFNKLPRLIKVFQFINKNYDLILKNTLYREDLSAFMYPGQAFKDASIRKLISDFNKLIEKFAIQKELEGDKVDVNLKLLKQLRKNRIEDKFERLYKETNKLNEEDRSEVDQYYENRMRLINEQFELLFHKSIKEKKDIFQKKSDMLDLEFTMKKIYLYEAMMSLQEINKEIKYNYSFKTGIEDYILSNKKSIIKNEPELYRNYLQLKIYSDKNNAKLLNELRDFIYTGYPKEQVLRPLIDLSNMFTYFGLRNSNQHKNYVAKNFEVYKYIEENKLLNNVKHIHHYNFTKAVQAGLNAKEYDWTKNFIDKYKNKIEPEFKDDTKNFSLGKLHYELKDYNKALFHFSLVNFKDYYFYTNAKKMLVRIEYELNNFENVLSQIESIKKYFNTHSEITDVYKVDTVNYILILNELANWQLKKHDKNEKLFRKSKLLKKLEQDKSNVVYYNWLLDKINELK